ncbi:MAG: hypothetical protein ABI584_11190 [Acidobacteriota bacterium]
MSDRSPALDDEIAAFDASLTDLLKHHAGKFALFHSRKLEGTFTTELEAYSEGVRRFGSESFLIRQVLPEQVVAAAPALFAGLLGARP